ncbi:MAG: hypothetical protein IJ400_04895 [Clostridia bacterium]|nr:hypothetical protein [Clostridia bacterium]
MKYVTPEYMREVISSEDIMEFSPNNIEVSEESFDFGDGNGAQTVSKGTATASILDLLFN